VKPSHRPSHRPASVSATVVAFVAAAAVAAVLLGACSAPRPGSGSGAAGGGRDDGRVRVGVVGAFSGPLSYVGNAVEGGVRYAVDVLNEKGGVLGDTIEIVRCDGRFEPNVEKNCLTKLTQKDDVDMVVLDSPILPAIEPRFIRTLGVPVFLPVTPPPGMDVTTLPNVFAIAPEGDAPEVLTNHLVTVTGTSRVGVLAVDDVVGRLGRDQLTAALSRRGLQPTAVETFAPGQADLSVEMKSLRDSGADTVVLLTTGADGAKALKAAERLDWSPQFAGTQSLYMRAYRELGQKATDGTLVVLPRAGDAENVDTAFLVWVLDYFRRYGVKAITVGKNASPDYPGLELPAFELTTAWAEAVEAAGTTNAGKVVLTLERSDGVRAVSRTLRWRTDDHVATVDPAGELFVARFTRGHVDYSSDPRAVPAFEETRIAVESAAFADGPPKANAESLVQLATLWQRELRAREGELRAQVGDARADAALARADDAVQLAAAFAGSGATTTTKAD
jgi:branched-chain amino acid transport system substrate-binding protein